MDISNGKGWNLGDALHLLEIAVMLISIGIAYEKFDENARSVLTHTQQLNRIEHYLSAHDTSYWQQSKTDE